MKPLKRMRLQFLALSAVALFSLYVVFEYSYIWHLSINDSRILRGGLIIGILMIIAIWVYYPSYLAVIVAGGLTLIFPVIIKIGRNTSWGELWPPLPEIVCLLLLIGATAIRRRLAVFTHDKGPGSNQT